MTDRNPLPVRTDDARPATPPGLSLRSAGLLACVPPGRAFLAGGRLVHLQLAVALGATAVLALVFLAYALLEAEPRFLLLAAPTAAGAAAAGTLVERRLRHRRHAAATRDEHVDAALWARERRAAARALAERDPQLARDLRIGRPDLPHPYDDGGLVDLNSAPAAVLVGQLELTQAEAGRVVALRERLGRFRSPDDLVALAGLGQVRVDRLADRLVVLP